MFRIKKFIYFFNLEKKYRQQNLIIFLHVHISIYLELSIYQSIQKYIYLSLYSPLPYVSITQSVGEAVLSESIYLSMYLSIYQSIYRSFQLNINLYLFVWNNIFIVFTFLLQFLDETKDIKFFTYFDLDTYRYIFS